MKMKPKPKPVSKRLLAKVPVTICPPGSAITQSATFTRGGKPLFPSRRAAAAAAAERLEKTRQREARRHAAARRAKRRAAREKQ